MCRPSCTQHGVHHLSDWLMSAQQLKVNNDCMACVGVPSDSYGRRIQMEDVVPYRYP